MHKLAIFLMAFAVAGCTSTPVTPVSKSPSEATTMTASAQQDANSPLKLAFERARKESDMAIALVALLKTDLYVVAGSPNTDAKEFFIKSSPTKGRMCVTVTEKEEWLQSIKWPKIKMSGLELVNSIQESWEIVVIYPGGGDYVTKEHLSWLRKALKETQDAGA